MQRKYYSYLRLLRLKHAKKDVLHPQSLLTNSELSKLTLVMATYGRQKHAIRNMTYWSNTGVIFLVLDASPIPISNEILKNFSDNIIYIHDKSHYNQRLVNSFSKINIF